MERELTRFRRDESAGLDMLMEFEAVIRETFERDCWEAAESIAERVFCVLARDYDLGAWSHTCEFLQATWPR